MATIDRAKIALEPFSVPEYVDAIKRAGGHVAKLSDDVAALIWLDYSKPTELTALLDANSQIEWVQLPFAGVDAFSEILKRPITFTSAKGSYAEPVAEHAMALALALGRIIPERVRAQSWGRRFATSFYDSEIVIVGGGGITEELLKFLSPYRAKITVVRKRPGVSLDGCREVGFDELDAVLPMADLVFLNCALTDLTRGLFDKARFSVMKPTALLVNVARGPVVNTADLIDALNNDEIAGAALDVTDPEPLPDGHPLWTAKNVLITPHTADTKEQVIRLFSRRIEANVTVYRAGNDWVGLVDAELGY
jgi:phosphoglycerate dehydrogenase-like enzyme